MVYLDSLLHVQYSRLSFHVSRGFTLLATNQRQIPICHGAYSLSKLRGSKETGWFVDMD